MRCGRCNAGQSRPVLGSRHRELCDVCVPLVGATITDEVRAGVDYYLASDPRGPVVGQIVGILRGGRA